MPTEHRPRRGTGGGGGEGREVWGVGLREQPRETTDLNGNRVRFRGAHSLKRGIWQKGLPQELILKQTLFSGSFFYSIFFPSPFFIVVAVSSFVYSGTFGRHKEGKLDRNRERWAGPLNIFLRM